MAEIYDNASAEHSQIIEQIKAEYKKKMQAVVEKAKESMHREAVVILGREFVELVTQRKKLLAEYRVKTKELLEYAIRNGIGADVKQLSDWSKTYDKSKEKSGKGTQLLEIVVEKVRLINPKMVSAFKEIENDLKNNNAKIIELMKNKKSELQALQTKARAQLQKELVPIIVELNNKIKVVNQSFGVETVKQTTESILDETDKTLNISFEGESGEDDIFIPSGTDDVN